MKNIILYGAGKRGKKVADFLRRKNILIAGFCDTNISGQKIEWGGVMLPIYSLEWLVENREDCLVIVTITAYYEKSKVEKNLKENGIEYTTIEALLNEDSSDVIGGNRKYIADYHLNEMENYFKMAEAEDNIKIFWREESEFRKLFSFLDLDRVVELACGRGRHVPQYIELANEVILIDILDRNIQFCKERFRNISKIQYYVNNGHDLEQLASDSCSALLTYDAMVHFEMLDIFEYLRETRRVLKLGGRALFHHSNNTEDYRVTFSTGTNGRNYMSKQLFAYLANRAGLEVLEQRVIDWGGKKGLDCLTLVEKR